MLHHTVFVIHYKPEIISKNVPKLGKFEPKSLSREKYHTEWPKMGL